MKLYIFYESTIWSQWLVHESFKGFQKRDGLFWIMCPCLQKKE